ncbi:Aryl-phospho-beta-D-glucosidase BglC, GH1 family [Paenibacillus sp. BC26]|nr:Aryl-phospho-beta-D-glucosidase BglC, GH1 family [Paenibacillus sp. BC26]
MSMASMASMKKWTAVVAAFLLFFSLANQVAPNLASASTDEPEILFESDFGNADGWVLDSTLSIVNGKLHSDSWSDYLQSAITTQSFDGSYSFQADVAAPLSSGHWNATRLIWGYQDANNYYELVLGNGSVANNAANVSLKKFVNNVEASLATDIVYGLGGKTTTLQVLSEEDGHISVNALQGDTVTNLFDRVEDQTFTSGQIGIGVRSSQIDYDNFRVVRSVEPLTAPEPPEVPVVETPTMADGNFEVQGSEIKDPSGNAYIAKGVNVNGPRWPWSRPTLPDVSAIVDNWKFNTVRVNMFPRMEHWNINNNMDLDGIVNAFTSRHVVTMLENHDFTGSYPGETGITESDGSYSMSVDELKAYWVDLATTYKDNPYVWFNIMNEPGQAGKGYSTSESIARWKEVHEEIIAAIRAIGAENIIVLDGHFYGQEGGFRNGTSDSAILSVGEELAATYDNLVFSLHMYGEWFNGQQRLANYLDEAASKGLALIIGEYGGGDSQTTNVTAAMFNEAVQRHVGRLVWAWEGEDQFDLTANTTKGGGWEVDKLDGSRPTNLSWLGSQVWDDNHNTLTLPVTLNLPVMVNGSFEDGLTGWQNWSRAELATGVGIDNSKAFKVPAGGAGGGGQFVTVKPNTTYTLTVWGKVSGAIEADTADAGFQYRPTEQSPDSEQIKFILSFDSTEWTKKEIIFTTGPSVAGANVFIWKSAEGVDLLVDNVSLAEQPPIVVNGDFEKDLDAWMNWGRLEAAAGAGIGGSKALKVTAGGAGGGGQYVTVKPNTTYKLTIWGKVSGATDADGAAAGFQYRPTEQSPDTEQIKHVLSFDSTEWTKKEVVFKTGASVAASNVFIWKNAADVDLLIDNVQLAETNETPTDPTDPTDPAEPQGIVIDSAIFRNAAGDEIEGLPASGMLSAEVTVTNHDEAQSALMVIALYDANGDIASLSYVQKTLAEGETVSFSGGFNLPANTEGYAVKVMLWNNFEDMEPLADAITL